MFLYMDILNNIHRCTCTLRTVVKIHRCNRAYLLLQFQKFVFHEGFITVHCKIMSHNSLFP